MDVPVWFRQQRLGVFAADLIVEDCVIVELKAVRSIDPAHEAQLLHYLRATEIEIGLLLNFGVKPEVKRKIYDNPRKAVRAALDEKGNKFENLGDIRLENS